ncbi:hypothetical protein KJ616_02595 [Patescibacteria group bacterium]|nr:hypothetical protein [Patescibacteria group bacterium]
MLLVSIILLIYIMAVRFPLAIIPNQDFIFHYNNFIGNYENFDGIHSPIAYSERPPLVNIVSTPLLPFITKQLFAQYWFILIWTLLPITWYFALDKKPHALIFLLATATPYFFWFTGTLSQFLATIIWIVEIKMLSKPLTKKNIGILLLLNALGSLSHGYFLELSLTTIIVFIATKWLHLVEVFKKYFPAVIPIPSEIKQFSLNTSAFTTYDTILKFTPIGFVLLSRFTDFRFLLMIVIFQLSYLVEPRLLIHSGLLAAWLASETYENTKKEGISKTMILFYVFITISIQWFF